MRSHAAGSALELGQELALGVAGRVLAQVHLAGPPDGLGHRGGDQRVQGVEAGRRDHLIHVRLRRAVVPRRKPAAQIQHSSHSCTRCSGHKHHSKVGNPRPGATLASCWGTYCMLQD